MQVDSRVSTIDREIVLEIEFRLEDESSLGAQVGGLRNTTVPGMEGVLNGVKVVLVSGNLGQI